MGIQKGGQGQGYRYFGLVILLLLAGCSKYEVEERGLVSNNFDPPLEVEAFCVEQVCRIRVDNPQRAPLEVWGAVWFVSDKMRQAEERLLARFEEPQLLQVWQVPETPQGFTRLIEVKIYMNDQLILQEVTR